MKLKLLSEQLRGSVGVDVILESNKSKAPGDAYSKDDDRRANFATNILAHKDTEYYVRAVNLGETLKYFTGKQVAEFEAGRSSDNVFINFFSNFGVSDLGLCVYRDLKIDHNLVKGGELIIQFDSAYKNFDCDGIGLQSLVGGPRRVMGRFNCSKNKLESLSGCPIKIDGAFFCANNKITSLEGCPEKIGSHFICHDNSLTNLVGGPERVGLNYECDANPLKNLDGLALYIGGAFKGPAGFVPNEVDQKLLASAVKGSVTF